MLDDEKYLAEADEKAMAELREYARGVMVALAGKSEPRPHR